MKNSTAITILVVSLLLAGGLVLVTLKTSAPSASTTQSTEAGGGGTFGGEGNVTQYGAPAPGVQGGGQGTATISVASAGGKISVQDFTQTSVKDTVNPGYSYLSGGSTQGVVKDTPYAITYIAAQQSFTITLLKEPLGMVRQQAEQDLMHQLGITQDQMCQLNYIVLEPYDLNPLYAGKNLGFSFCPGAVQLP